jgi:hypothetical protein
MPRSFAAWLVFVLALMAGVSAPASEAAAGSIPAEVIAADDGRIAAMVACDRERLAAALSDELHYTHSNGVVETKAQHVDAIISRRLVYRAVDYTERSFQTIAPDVVLMRGRAQMDVRSGDQALLLDLSFLAVWRLEQGAWRLVAWQSSRRPAAATS